MRQPRRWAGTSGKLRPLLGELALGSLISILGMREGAKCGCPDASKLTIRSVCLASH